MQKNTNDGLEAGLTPQEEQGLIFSPNENEELLIEGDEKTEIIEETQIVPEVEDAVQSTAEEVSELIQDEIQEEKETEPQPQAEEPDLVTPEPEAVEDSTEDTETKTAPVVPKTGQAKGQKKKKKESKEPAKKESKGGCFLWILLLLLLLLIGGALWYYYTQYNKPTETPVVEEKESPVDTTSKKVIAPEPMVIDDVPEPDSSEIEKPYIPERIASPNKVPSGWVIGYKATPDEVLAIKTVAELSYVDELPCGYYWIPDSRKNGQKMFKIYIGPYKTKEDAEAILPKIKEKMADAHVYSEE